MPANNNNARRLVGVVDAEKLGASTYATLAQTAITRQRFEPLDAVYIQHGDDGLVVRLSCTLEAHKNTVRIKGTQVQVERAYPQDMLFELAMQIPQVTTTPSVYLITHVIEKNLTRLEVWLHVNDPHTGADSWTAATQAQLDRWGVPTDGITGTLFGSTIAPRLRAEGLVGVHHTTSVKQTAQQLLNQERENNISKSVYRYIRTSTHNATAEVLQALRARSWEGAPFDGVSKTPLGLSGLIALAHRSRDNDIVRAGRFDHDDTTNAIRTGIDKDGNAVEVEIKRVKLKLTPKAEAAATRRRFGRSKHKDLIGQVSLFVDPDEGKEGESVDEQAMRLIMAFDVPAIQAAHVLLGAALRTDSKTVLATPTNLAVLLGRTQRLNGLEYKQFADTIATVEAMGVGIPIDARRDVEVLMFDREATVFERNADGINRAYHILKPSTKLFASMFEGNKGRGVMFVLDDLARMDAAVCDLEIRLGYVACEEHALGYATRYARGQTPYRTLGFWARNADAMRTLEKLKSNKGLPAMRARVEMAAAKLGEIGLDVGIEWDNASVWDSKVTFAARRLELAQQHARGDILTAAKAKRGKYLKGEIVKPKRKRKESI